MKKDNAEQTLMQYCGEELGCEEVLEYGTQILLYEHAAKLDRQLGAERDRWDKEIDELRQRVLDEQAAFDKMEQLYLIADARMFWMEENGGWQDNDCFAIAMEEPWYHEDLRTAVDRQRGMFDDKRTDGGG